MAKELIRSVTPAVSIAKQNIPTIIADCEDTTIRQILRLANSGNVLGFKDYLSLRPSLNTYHNIAFAAKLLAFHGYEIDSPALKFLIDYGNVSIRNIAIGYAMSDNLALAEDMVITGINGKKASVTDVAIGLALHGKKVSVERMVTFGINGQKASVSDVTIGYAMGGNKVLAEAMVTHGINGQKASVIDLGIGYAMGNFGDLAKNMVTHGINGQKISVNYLALGYARDRNKVMAEKMVRFGINGEKASVNYLALGYAMDGHEDLAELMVTSGIDGQKASIDVVGNGFARGGKQALAEKMMTIGINGEKASAIEVVRGYVLVGYTALADNLLQKLKPQLVPTENALIEDKPNDSVDLVIYAKKLEQELAIQKQCNQELFNHIVEKAYGERVYGFKLSEYDSEGSLDSPFCREYNFTTPNNTPRVSPLGFVAKLEEERRLSCASSCISR